MTNKKLPSSASIFTAELRAILTAVMLSIRYEDHNFIIFSDSKSALQSVCNSFSSNPIVTEIHRWISMVQSLNKNITFCWVPSHVGVRGNEEADRAAGEIAASDAHVPNMALPHRDYYAQFNQDMHKKWQQSWNNQPNNKLYRIKTELKNWATSSRKSRCQEVLLARLRMGHTRRTHEHLLKGEPRPYCEDCLVPLTVSHLLVECPEYLDERRPHFGTAAVSLIDILKDDESCILKLLHFLDAANIRIY